MHASKRHAPSSATFIQQLPQDVLGSSALSVKVNVLPANPPDAALSNNIEALEATRSDEEKSVLESVHRLIVYVVSKMKGFFGRLLHPGRPLVKLALSRSLCSMSFRYLIFIDSFVVQFMGQVAYSCLQGTVARTCSKIGWEERKCKESARLELAPSSVQAVALSGLSNPIRYSWHLAWICLCSLCSQMFEWCQQRVPTQRSHLWCRYECTLELEFRIDA